MQWNLSNVQKIQRASNFQWSSQNRIICLWYNAYHYLYMLYHHTICIHIFHLCGMGMLVWIYWMDCMFLSSKWSISNWYSIVMLFLLIKIEIDISWNCFSAQKMDLLFIDNWFNHSIHHSSISYISIFSRMEWYCNSLGIKNCIST